jgi:hypothetical protein
VGQLYTLVATARDTYSNIVPQIELDDFSTTNFRVILVPSMGFFQLAPLANNSVSIEFNTTVAGKYNLTIYFNTAVLLATTLVVLPGQIVCVNSVISPSLNGSLNVGNATTSYITTTDVYHNLVYSNPLTAYKVQFSSQEITYNTTDFENGTIELDYFTDSTGAYTCLITCTGVDTKTWFYNLSAIPGYPVISKSTISPTVFQILP